MIEDNVHRRYSAAAKQFEPALRCPIEYASEHLSVIPDEILERDYGCGDPTPYLQSRDTVLDLGAGGGKLCFIAAQVVAHKGKQGPCLERNQAVIYRGPFKEVVDDDGHTYHRGQRMAVCDKTFQLLTKAPYQGLFESIEPRELISIDQAQSCGCGLNN